MGLLLFLALNGAPRHVFQVWINKIKINVFHSCYSSVGLWSACWGGEGEREEGREGEGGRMRGKGKKDRGRREKAFLKANVKE